MSGLTGQGSPFEVEKHLALPNGIEDLTLTADLTIDLTYGNRLRIDPGGAHRDVTLPAHRNGLNYHIVNTANAAENLVIKDSEGNAQLTLNQDESVIIQSNGSDWKHMGVVTVAQT